MVVVPPSTEGHVWVLLVVVVFVEVVEVHHSIQEDWVAEFQQQE